MADMTPREQLMLELINRARMDPAGEAKRFHIALNEGVASGDKISSAPKQVLAGRDTLAAAADNHSSWMLNNDNFSHFETFGTDGFTGVNPGDRATHAGYPTTNVGENISFRGTSASITAAEQTQMIIQQHADLFIDQGVSGRGHRLNILDGDYQEVGIGQQNGKFTDSGGSFNSSMVTQDFGLGSGGAFITGVVYNDTVIKDDFFSVGEQVVGRTVSSVGAASDLTGAGGGYELLYDTAGAKSVVFDLAGGEISVGLKLGTTNAKVDVVNGREVWTDTSLTSVSIHVTELHALGIGAVSFLGADSSQKMFGNSAANTLKGNGGNDVLVGGAGQDKLTGGSGADTFFFAKGDSAPTHKAADTIFDFSHAQSDKIDLTHWDANTKASGTQDFHFIGSQDFHHKAGELHFVKQSSDTYVDGDTNGDGKLDFSIHLDDAVGLKVGDFML
jgi:Ca2+-binding RTX toxin-like protein